MSGGELRKLAMIGALLGGMPSEPTAYPAGHGKVRSGTKRASGKNRDKVKAARKQRHRAHKRARP